MKIPNVVQKLRGLMRINRGEPAEEAPQSETLRQEGQHLAEDAASPNLRGAGNKLCVRGDWDTTPVEGGQKPILLLPLGPVFGNGYHYSTRRFLQEIESLVRPGDTVVDIGTGSGILAIAAAHLGAGVVYATDLNLAAREMAQANAALNRVSGTIVVSRELPPLSPFVDVILANLGADDLLPEVFQTAGAILRGAQGHIMVVASNKAGSWAEAEALLHGLTKIKAIPTDEALYLIFGGKG